LSRYACLLGRDSPSRGRRCFFFQAEDGIRAFHVTGVQTCALPILAERYFGPIEKREIPSAKRPLELDEPGERRLTLHLNTQVPKIGRASCRERGWLAVADVSVERNSGETMGRAYRAAVQHGEGRHW